ncbi:MAG TPA: hypothetical protein VFX20_18215 [Steroidobacteraceae bacterium]|nr:hypothetical protein [Steroidobacteraceae bacterium]
MRTPTQLVRAVVWLTSKLLLSGRDITRAQLWLLPQELAMLTVCRGDAIERDTYGRPIRLCGMRLRVLGVWESETKRAPGA